MASETPDYTVLKTDGAIEIRKYSSMLIAEVTVDGDRDQAGSRAFSKLGGFIFGNNQSQSKVDMTAPVTQTPASEKIAMTAPVTQTPVSETPTSEKIDMTAPVNYIPSGTERWIVNFMLPSEYTMETLPIPNDPDIRVRMTEPYKAVTLRFSGRAGMRSMEKNTQELQDYIAANDLNVEGPPDYAFYNAPYVPGPLRRNEVHYRLVD